MSSLAFCLYLVYNKVVHFPNKENLYESLLQKTLENFD